MTDSNFESVVSNARDKVIPNDNEVAQMKNAAAELRDAARSELQDRGYPEVSITQTGSTARETWVSGDRDIDLFLEFPPSTTEETLETIGIEVGEAILPNSKRDFASHPYTKGSFKGFDVDVVPCFSVESAEKIKSAVDRTPFHTRFLEDALSTEQRNDVRVAKKFLKSIGVYGSDVNTQGFSGYLTELFILNYGNFKQFLTAGASWSYPLRIDVADINSGTTFSSDIVVIDPTDPSRNVADALSIEKAAEFQYYAREFLKQPSESFFKQEEQTLSANKITEKMTQRGTEFIGILIDTPTTLVEDTLIPQLRKTQESTHTVLKELNFPVVSSFVDSTDQKSILVFELETTTLPKMEKHQGPPVEMKDPTERFITSLSDEAQGPFIKDNRIVARVQREFTDVQDFLRSDSFRQQVSIGSDLKSVIESREIVSLKNNDEYLSEFSEGFTAELENLP